MPTIVRDERLQPSYQESFPTYAWSQVGLRVGLAGLAVGGLFLSSAPACAHAPQFSEGPRGLTVVSRGGDWGRERVGLLGLPTVYKT